MTRRAIRGPRRRVLAVVADERGRLHVDPRYDLAIFDGQGVRRPRADELSPLPRGSDLFYLPGRHALGMRPAGQTAEPIMSSRGRPRLAASSFIAPAWLRLAHPAASPAPEGPALPMFAYSPLGFVDDHYVTCALRIDPEARQDPWRFDLERIRGRVEHALARSPRNRLIHHLSHCALTYSCRAAQNYFLGRWEAPLPTARTCNARCLGCISKQDDPALCASHDRIAFEPTPDEIAEVALTHAARAKAPVVSFGQGCEGEPILRADLLEAAVRLIRARDESVTINLNSNASRPEAIRALFAAGLSSLRVSLNSVRAAPYDAYFRPHGYRFDDVLASIDVARAAGGFVSLNYFTFPGFTDREEEVVALEALIARTDLDMIQWRNLNIDPERYLATVPPAEGTILGLPAMLARLRERFPALRHGYFNPYLPRPGAA